MRRGTLEVATWRDLSPLIPPNGGTQIKGRHRRKVGSLGDHQDRPRLRNLLLEGASSPPTEPLDDAYFDGLREQVRSRKAG